jgi:hypothetical protein
MDNEVEYLEFVDNKMTENPTFFSNLNLYEHFPITKLNRFKTKRKKRESFTTTIALLETI